MSALVTSRARRVPSELAGAAAAHVAARHRQIRLLAARHVEQLGNQGLIVLQVRVHHGEVRRGARQHAFDARGGEAAPADALDAAHPGIALRALAHQVFAAVVGIVDHDDGFPVEAGERLLERIQQPRQVLALAKRRHHDGKLRHRRPS